MNTTHSSLVKDLSRIISYDIPEVLKIYSDK